MDTQYFPTPPSSPVGPTVTTDSEGNPILPPLPFVTISEKVSIHKLPRWFEKTLETATAPDNWPPGSPLLLAYFVGAGLPHIVMPLLPVQPDRLFVMAGDPIARAAVMAALSAVEILEPNYGKKHLGRLAIGERTPFKAVFRQMAEVPMTVFSITFPQTGGSFFFLRTPFTIEHFLDELTKVLAHPPGSVDPCSN